MTGHLLGGAGALESLATLLALYHKYRVGDSLRVVYRLSRPAEPRLVASRTFGPTAPPPSTPRPASGARLGGAARRRPRPGAARRSSGRSPTTASCALGALAPAAGIVAELSAALARTSLAAYAPEKCAAAACLDERGRRSPTPRSTPGRGGRAPHDVHAALFRRARAPTTPRSGCPPARRRRRGRARVEPAARPPRRRARRRRARRRLRRLGAALADAPRACPPRTAWSRSPAWRRAPADGGRIVGRARPDVAARAARLADALEAAAPADPARPSACTATSTSRTRSYQRRRVALIDLDQAGCGPAAADLGSVLAGMRYARAHGRRGRPRRRRAQRALLDGYAAVPPLPARRAALAHRRRAARRARAARGQPRPPEGLAHLGDLLADARVVLRRGPVVSRPPCCFYCQHSLGLGHLVRSLALADALTERFRVVLLSGGRMPRGVAARRRRGRRAAAAGHGHGRRAGQPRPPPAPTRALQLRREQMLAAPRRAAPRVVLVELFPFGRKSSTSELLPLLEAARAAGAAGRLQPARHPRRARAATRPRTTSGRADSPTRSSTRCSCTPTRASRGWRSPSARGRRCACPSTTPASSLPGADRAAAPAAAPRGPPRSSSRPAAALSGRRCCARPSRPTASSWRRRARPCRLIAGPFLPDAAWRALRAAAPRAPGLEVRRSVPDLVRRAAHGRRLGQPVRLQHGARPAALRRRRRSSCRSRRAARTSRPGGPSGWPRSARCACSTPAR